jgi:site-specific DNA recombinase
MLEPYHVRCVRRYYVQTMGRVLGRVRLSRSTDESTSEERQREIIETWASMHGHEIVGWAVDLDVSRSVDPFDSPDLGPWFSEPERVSSWDILACWKLDRVATGSIYLNKVMAWCFENEKDLVSVTENFDLSTWVGRLIAGVIAGVAEGELEAIKERTGASRAKLRTLGRWAGGKAPYGYRAVKNGNGWKLEPSQPEADRVREIASQAAERRSIMSIAKRLNEEGVPSPRGGGWTAQTITRMLRSRWVLGQSEHNGQVVRGEDHLPLQVAEPLIDLDLWQQVQAVLDDRKRPKKRKNETGLLLNIAYCLLCREPLWHNVMVSRGVTYRYWRCSSRHKKQPKDCPAPGVPAEMLEDFVAEQFMSEIGDMERTEPVYIPAEGHAEEINRLAEAITLTRKEKDLGLYEGDDDGYLARLTELTNRKRILEAQPGRPARWERRGVGETWAQGWERLDTAERRELLLDAGVKVHAHMFARNSPEFHFYVDLNGINRLRLPEGLVAGSN